MGVRVCAFATWDGHIKPGKTNEPLHMVDWYSTLLKLAGAKLEQKQPLDGLDAWATIAEGKPSPHKEILINTAPNSGAIRVGDWKYVVHNGVDDPDGAPAPKKKKNVVPGEELFNLADDLSEKKNLAKEMPEKVKELKARYDFYAKQAIAPKAKPKSKDFVTPKVWGEK